MIRTIMLAAVTALALSGCAQIGMFTQTDATQAAAIAMAVGDTQGAQCFAGIGTVAGAVGGSSQPGVLTALESKLAFEQSLRNPACAPTFAAVLGELLKAAPGVAPFVP